MANVPNSSLKTWNDGDVLHATDYSQDRSILQTAINDNYAKLILKYDKTDVDNLLNAMRGTGWTTQTIKDNWDLIQAIQTDITNLQSQTTKLSSDGTNYTGAWYNMQPSQIATSTVNWYEKQWTATQGQTVFQLTGSDKLYTPNSETTWVMVGGVAQTVGQGYTETDNKTITLAEGVDSGTVVEMRYFLNNAAAETPITNMVGYQENVANPINTNTAQLAENVTKAIKILTQSVKENDDITSVLNTLFLNGNTEVDLMGYNFTISGVVTMNDSCVLKNGTLTLTGTGKIIMSGQYSTVKYINFIGQNITSSSVKDGAVIVQKSHNRLFKLTFSSVITAIAVGRSDGTGFFDVNMSFILIKSCSTGFYIYADVLNSWLSAINIDNAVIIYKQFGMVFTRGNMITDKTMRQQLSHCNVSNIIFQDVRDTSEASGIYINVGWNNFTNLNFFDDGNQSYPSHSIRFDPAIDTTTTNNSNLTTWDVIYGFRSNNFSNMFVEGDLVFNGQYHLNKFKNLKLAYNNPSKTILSGAPSNTNGFVSYDSKITSIQSLISTSSLSLVAPTVSQITMTKNSDNTYSITNTLSSSSPAYVKLVLDNIVKQKCAATITDELMVMTLCADGETSITSGNYQYKLTDQNNTTITGADYCTTDGIITTKGQIGIGMFELLQVNKSLFTNATSINLFIRIVVPANTTVTLKDFRVYPYKVTALNDDNVDWHNDYLN